MINDRNLQVVLARYPKGMPVEEDFDFVEGPVPEPGPGQFLVRTILLSLDPWMRLRMKEPVEYRRWSPKNQMLNLGDVVNGAVIGQVVASRHPDFQEGQLIESKLGWQRYALYDGSGDRLNNGAGFTRVDPMLGPPSAWLGPLGRTGMTAYFGVMKTCAPKAGDTMVVGSAAGATGSVAGQIARIKGCRVVGLTGSDAKVKWLEQLGFDAAINYRAVPDLGAALRAACPSGIDCYFDCTGGTISDAVLPLINDHARWAVIGVIAEYGQDMHTQLGPRPYAMLLARRAKMEGMIVHDWAREHPAAIREIAGWMKEGRLRSTDYIVEGLEKAPATFIHMLQGGNLGKTMIRVSPDP